MRNNFSDTIAEMILVKYNSNRSKCPISAMCNILNVSRRDVYTYVDSSEKGDEYAEKVTKVFYDSHGIYET